MQRSRGKERKDKKAFIKEQCKGVEENNAKGKTRDRFKNIGDKKVYWDTWQCLTGTCN